MGDSRYIDEDVSWLEAGGRMLARAEDESLPLRERVALLAGAGRALDEFFQFRGAGLRAVVAGGPPKGRGLRMAIAALVARQDRLTRRLVVRLSAEGYGVCDWALLDRVQRRSLTDVFRERFLPNLAPLVTEAGQRSPEAASLSLNLACAVVAGNGEPGFGWVELPPVLERFVALPESGKYPLARRVVPLEQVVAAHLPELFPGFAVAGHGMYRVTRHGGVAVAPGTEDLLGAVEAQTRSPRGRAPVRLEVGHQITDARRDRLVADLGLGASDVYRVDGLMATADLTGCLPSAVLPSRSHPDRSAGPYDAEVEHPFATVARSDMLVHLPDGTSPISVAGLLSRAARDPRVLAVKQTLFRPDPQGPVVKALVRAAERGTHVVAVVELATRHRERDGVACARALERAGAHVVYGLAGLRTHCSVSLVVVNEERGIGRYSLVSAGPHHGGDGSHHLALCSADPALGADLADLFNYLTGYSRPGGYRKLLVGPGGLRRGLLALIRREAAAGPAGRIALALQRLVDHEMIDALYAAGRAGVDIDIMVAGACALRPGVAGLSETIRVLAPPGGEPGASRCLGFGRGAERSWYLSSADLAGGNLDRAVDVAVPVADPWCAQRLGEYYDALVEAAAWSLGPDGSWRQRSRQPAPVYEVSATAR